MIFTDADEITPDNILSVLDKAFVDHMSNVSDEIYLFNYVAGVQPILDREKPIREEINERVVVNDASRIKNFKVGYEFSNPITYVKSGEVKALSGKRNKILDRIFGRDKEVEDSKRIMALNEMLREQSKPSKDIALADSMKTCGLGYRLILPNESDSDLSVFRITTLNPMMAFVVYKNDAFRDPMLGVSYSVLDNGTMKIGAWSKKNYFEVIRGIGKNGKCDPAFTVSPWIYDEIPVIEYANERDILGRSFSCFESVISILDEMNTVNSDRANDIAQFVQSLLWFHNCELDDEQKQKLVDGNGLVITKSTGDGREAKITYLTQTLNQSEIQSYVDYLKQEVQEIAGVPMFGISTGGSTGIATNMSNGYSEADSRAQTSEQGFEEPERRAIKVMLAIASKHRDKDEADVGSLRVSDIGIKFTRNKSYNLTDKVNAWATMLKNGADPLRATEIASFTTDTQQFVQDSAEMIKKIQESYANSETGASPQASGKPDAGKIMQDNSDQHQNSPAMNR